MRTLRLPMLLVDTLLHNAPAGWAAEKVTPNPYPGTPWESVRVTGPRTFATDADMVAALRAAFDEREAAEKAARREAEIARLRVERPIGHPDNDYRGGAWNR